ncbi:MAG: hypothetical protein ABIA04_00425 [Pseudomonadota bacterium]
MRKLFIILSILPILFSCSIKSKDGFNATPDEIIFKSQDNTPDWAEAKKRFINKEKLYIVGMAEIPGDSSPEKGIEIASMNAKSSLAQEINTKLESQVQTASEGLGIDKTVLNKIIAIGSKLDNLVGIFTEETYYQKIATSDGYTQTTKYQCFALVGIDLKEYHRQINISIANSIGDKELSESFKKKVEAQWDTFFNSK